jgi:hypothetical protein
MPTSTSSGDAPGQLALTVIVGLLTSGNWLTPMPFVPGNSPSDTRPNSMVPHISIHAKTGLRRQRSVMFTGPSPCGGAPTRDLRRPSLRRIRQQRRSHRYRAGAAA